jgi:1-acyl-sn-glycerol-3-phosphate acyltransferase
MALFSVPAGLDHALLTGAQARWLAAKAMAARPRREQRIYFANHQSHADLVMIWAALPQELRSITRPIAARDYWTKTPFKQWITTAVFNAVYVDRERKADEDPLQPLIDALTNGDSIIIFPEGTRGHAEEPQPFKSGLYSLALRSPTWCWCRPGSTTCSASCPRARWCRCRCCARSPLAPR